MKYLLICSLFFSIAQADEPVNPPIPPIGPVVKVTDDQLVCNSITPGELATYDRLITKFGGKKVMVMDKGLTRSEEGLQNFIDQSGIRYFSAPEISTPHHEADAIACGIDNLIPPRCIWSNGAALLSIAERIRELIGGPIMFRNWWRPACYNALVEGSKASDHVLAKSIDIDFRTAHDRSVAQKFVCDELWKKGENIQVGIGCNSLHIGLASPKGKRFWIYESMKTCSVKMIDKCWEL